jgi:PAS domain S-box-containing protein
MLINSEIKKLYTFGKTGFQLYTKNFRELLSYINEPAAIVSIKNELIIIDLNEQYCRLLGKKRPEVINQNFLSFFSSDTRSLISNNFKDNDSEDDMLEGILEVDEKVRVSVEIRIQQLGEKDSGLFLVTFRDISVFRKIVTDLKNHQSWLERAETIAGIGYWEYDLRTSKLWGSRGARSIYGLDEREMTLDAIQKFSMPEYREKLDRALFNLINKGDKYDVEFEIVNDKDRNIFLHSMAEYDCFGKKVYGIIQDVTFKKKYEKDLVEAKNKAEESDKLKSAFLSNISHEIRTPMNGILGFSKLLIQPGITSETKTEYAEIIDTCCSKLLDIINNILDISKLETGQAKVNKTLTDITLIFNEIKDTYSDIIKKKGLEFKITYPEFKSNFIITDKEKIMQIFRNLMDNAVRFASEGFIEVGFKVYNDTAEFFVKDTGIGIAPHNHEIIFEPFRQAEINISSEYGGFGTGLTIVRKYVKILGGEVTVESEIGKGTLVKFTHPMGFENTNKINENKMKTMSCLVVEDFEINYQYLKAILTPTGINVIWAKNGSEALKHIKNGNKPDIVLMDIRLPDMNGYDVTKLIKQLHPHLPIIAQTANALVFEKEKAFLAGCDDYITKPICKELLLSKIDNYIRN